MKKNNLLSLCGIEILDSLVEGIFIIDKDFKIVYVNKVATEIIKLNAEELVGRVCISICKSERCQVGCPITEVLRSDRKVIDLESTIQDSTGKIIPIKLNASLLKDDQNEPIGGIISFREDSKINFAEYIKKQGHFYGIIGKSEKMQEIFSTIEDISRSDACVLISGDTGVGKEMIANAIQQTSFRRQKPFVKVNCASLPPTLLASELFGHVRGAFTGAVKDRVGRFEYADGGTIFLDEIAEMPLEMQSQLLRILQEGTFERIGESKTSKVDVRIIAASNKNLNDEIKKNLFRKDLYYRLNVIPIHVPPLIIRKDDIKSLVDHFIRKYSEKYGKKIKIAAPDTIDALLNYDWPGNIRELENAIEYAFIRSKRDDYLCICSLPPVLRGDENCRETLSTSEIEQDEKTETIIALLRQNNWNKTKVAQILGINRSTIHRRLKSFENN